MGVIPVNDPHVHHTNHIYPVLVDGVVVGWIHQKLAKKLIRSLRKMKLSSSDKIPYHTEIAYIRMEQKLSPAVYLFSAPSRLIRKVLNKHNKEEYIGIFEQVFLKGIHRQCEIESADILGLSTRMIPFCENNATVRNIFSSGKMKQALGLPFLNFNGRSASSTQHLVYGQSPCVSTKTYLRTNFDSYPCGTNVIVAILSYSGYDMEDALVLNKASVERGLMLNTLYKTNYYDFEDMANEYECGVSDLELKRNDMDPHVSSFLDRDGLPFIGTRMNPNDPVLSFYNKKKKVYIIKQYPERCVSFVHSVRLMGDVPCSTKNIPKNSKKLSITFCVRKSPEVGDKFTNRHGGKGICSALMNSEDLPFSVNGVVPDVLINPHGLPSRMSIGLLLEMIAAKSFIQRGLRYIIEPFELEDPSSGIGEALTKVGFSHYGSETFISGTSGAELTADVFCGSMYFLRLSHMVEEKYQVQSVGLMVDEKTNQPINPGKSGAVRFGEMERDAILSHGAMELTLDRLLLNSDKCTAYVCAKCQLLIPPSVEHPVPELRDLHPVQQKVCMMCHRSSDLKIRIPYPLVYLMWELAVLGIRVKLSHK